MYLQFINITTKQCLKFRNFIQHINTKTVKEPMKCFLFRFHFWLAVEVVDIDARLRACREFVLGLEVLPSVED